ncbi:hypothetical protein U1Q18_051663, partial [Sarracenia purpurea var. burkii]
MTKTTTRRNLLENCGISSAFPFPSIGIEIGTTRNHKSPSVSDNGFFSVLLKIWYDEFSHRVQKFSADAIRLSVLEVK